MNLYIAEKPSLARAIAEGIGRGEKKKGYISLDGGEQIVTWCFGHILAQYDPDEYDEKYKKWTLEDLPIVPSTWKLKVKKDAKEQFGIIKELIKKADYVINAGDPDREGQLLVDEVLEYVGNKKPVKRILLNALDDKSVKQALKDLRDNKDFKGMHDSALGRSRADWLVGMNLTRAFSIKSHEAGYEGALNVGRVKTPTMALVVRREQAIMNFKPVTHYQAHVVWQDGEGKIPTNWIMPEDLDGLDEEGRLLRKETAEGVLAAVEGKTGKVVNVEKKKKQVGQHLPYSLSALQIEAGKRYGYSPQEVLDTMQGLYEAKLTTYPRSDCDYLPENQFEGAAGVLRTLSGITVKGFDKLVARADTKIHSRAWNDKKISAHHAIVPTGENPKFDSLKPIEQNLYFMVAQAFLAQFFPPHTFESTKITVECEGYKFAGTGKTIIENGWRDIYAGVSDDEEDVPVLPDVDDGDAVIYKEGKVAEKVTKPPVRFTPATLLKAMKEIYKYVRDEALKAELKECSGIGTEATRAGIIEQLQKGGFLRTEKKYLVPTEKAEMAVKVLPEEITYPDVTAVWEKELEEVSDGKLSLTDFTSKQVEKINGFLEKAKKTSIATAENVPLCPNCKKPLRRRKGSKGFFWGCSGYPECKTTFPDKKGKPDFAAKKSSATGLTMKCPKCGKNLRQIKGKFGTFWGCEDKACGAAFPDHKDSPVIVKCPKCGKHWLKRLESKKKKGEYFWACQDFECKGFYKDVDGLPDVK